MTGAGRSVGCVMLLGVLGTLVLLVHGAFEEYRLIGVFNSVPFVGFLLLCVMLLGVWARVTSTEYVTHGDSAKTQQKTTYGDRTGGDLETGSLRPQEMKYGRATRHDITTGWRPTCEHADLQPIPQTVLDPFGGSGTTGLVADRFGRNAILSRAHAQSASRFLGAAQRTYPQGHVCLPPLRQPTLCSP